MLLHGTEVVAPCQETGGEAMPERVACCKLRDAGRPGLSIGPESSPSAWLIGPTYFRRENTPEILESNPFQESMQT